MKPGFSDYSVQFDNYAVLHEAGETTLVACG
ncbi:MAG: hypothetical protein BWY94_01255 [Actinobacteria bacterium ADurb.BinA094]|nr:MAG: hypothetical protein BWY94_01255 [Actinobacteria bacterium ADurb.BinA094]